jgi:hypothetical protein
VHACVREIGWREKRFQWEKVREDFLRFGEGVVHLEDMWRMGGRWIKGEEVLEGVICRFSGDKHGEREGSNLVD